MSYCLDTTALVLFATGDVTKAAELHAAAESTRAALDMPAWPILRRMLEAFGQQLRLALGDQGYALARERGRSDEPVRLLVTVTAGPGGDNPDGTERDTRTERRRTA
jgi:hypothetical protein